MIRDLYRLYRNEHWLSGVRLWVDAYRDFKAWRLNLKRIDPKGEHRRKVKGVRQNREFYAKISRIAPQQSLAQLLQNPYAAQNAMAQQSPYSNPYLNGLSGNLGAYRSGFGL